jgi:phage gp36-like protein
MFRFDPNIPKLVEILNTDNRKVYEKTIDFLKKLTKLSIKVRFNDTNEKKGEAKQAFWIWFQKHVQDLK